MGSLAIRRVHRMPFRKTFGFRIAQSQAGSLLVSPVTERIRAEMAKGRWSFAADGPIGFLAGRKPLVTLVARPFRLLFGRR